MSRWAVAAVLSSVVVSGVTFAAPPAGRRAQLVAQSTDRITTLARTITVVNWVGRCNETLAKQPAAQSLGAKWNPSEPHWDKAVDEMLTRVMGRFEELHDAPEALERLAKPFDTHLTEAEAQEILALSADDRRAVDDFADTMTLAISLLEHRSDLKPGSQDFKESLARLTGMAKLPEVKDVPKVKLAKKTLDDYRLSRSAAVDFYQTAMQGQLELFFFDHQDAFAAIATKAARAAGK
jgi:hypothetical protein